uniref:Alpha/beta hydrolase fold-3 domain-containing protein n=1 Tax=Chrysotila carterae TaxID=13221 RepID=A0A7S4ET57_CHRCT
MCVTMRRVYYTTAKRFEQSIDIYSPSGKNITPHQQTLPLVALVVGSAWLGHRSIIYAGTSWWNSSGPKQIASVGAVCVCIRHRGAFPHPPASFLVLFAVLSAAVCVSLWITSRHLAVFAAGLAAGACVVALLWELGWRGAATYLDMLNDVALALSWVRSNRESLAAPGCAPAPRLVFGGYSSGGHVAATLLQRLDVLARHGLPAPTHGLCDGVLYVSGVFLATKETKLRPTMMPGVCRWIVGTLVRSVFGAASAVLASPLRDAAHAPRLPHLLIHCEREAAGLWPVEGVMQRFIAGNAYAAALKSASINVEVVEIRSNHWSMLNSAGLRLALTECLLVKSWP